MSVQSDDVERQITGYIAKRERLSELMQKLPSAKVDPIVDKTVFAPVDANDLEHLTVQLVMAMTSMANAVAELVGENSEVKISLQNTLDSLRDILFTAGLISGVDDAVAKLEEIEAEADNG